MPRLAGYGMKEWQLWLGRHVRASNEGPTAGVKLKRLPPRFWTMTRRNARLLGTYSAKWSHPTVGPVERQ